jgi:hypothetical protein
VSQAGSSYSSRYSDASRKTQLARRERRELEAFRRDVVATFLLKSILVKVAAMPLANPRPPPKLAKRPRAKRSKSNNPPCSPCGATGQMNYSGEPDDLDETAPRCRECGGRGFLNAKAEGT